MIVAWSGIMFGDPFHIRYLDNLFKLFDNVGKVLHAEISDGISCLFLFLRPCFGLECQSSYQPLSWSPNFPFDSEDWGDQKRGVGNHSGSHDQSKVKKIQKGKVCHRKCRHEGPFQHYQRVWNFFQGTLGEKYPQTWSNFKLLSSSEVYCRVYDEIRWTQSERVWQLYRRDCSVIER